MISTKTAFLLGVLSCEGFSPHGTTCRPSWSVDCNRHVPFRSAPPLSLALNSSDEEKEISVVQRCIGRSSKEFWHGATYVHNNYLDLLGECFHKVKFLAPILALFVAGKLLFPNIAAVRFLSDSVRLALERFLILVALPTRFVGMSFMLPFKFVLLAAVRFLSDSVRLALERFLILVALPTLFVFKSFILPFKFVLISMTLAINGEFSLAGNVRIAKTLFRDLFRLSSPKARKAFSIQNRNVWFTALLVPLIEELGMRFAFSKFWRWLTPRDQNSEREQNIEGTNTTAKFWGILGIKELSRSTLVWALVSSFFFGGCHIANHLPTPSPSETSVMITEFQKTLAENISEIGVDEKMKKVFMEFGTPLCGISVEIGVDEKMKKVFMEFGARYVEYLSRCRPIINAMVQALITFTVSLLAFCPLFVSDGIMGAFGAHAAWNLFGMNSFWQIMIRLAVRR
eukprot:CAMPEP_0194264082 /NCGR_PEP_ID=MMETSP0158-20130606/47401_1 /TAXON_ID=33649 /ORGANISM="Thalassionema nitzschioides, Strain L26-B" /LENGTH=455 /DNA_ID=CAMNT_0039004311 /DNA_START=144 /DNA_END=1510 /DNA_ORIENTATION=-